VKKSGIHFLTIDFKGVIFRLFPPTLFLESSRTTGKRLFWCVGGSPGEKIGAIFPPRGWIGEAARQRGHELRCEGPKKGHNALAGVNGRPDRRRAQSTGASHGGSGLEYLDRRAAGRIGKPAKGANHPMRSQGEQ